MNFYGPANLADGSPLPEGATVLAVDPNGAVCGAAVVASEGQYGLLACYSDDPDSPEDEGAVAGDMIRLLVDGLVQGSGMWLAHGERRWAPLGEVELQRLYLPLMGQGVDMADGPPGKAPEAPLPWQMYMPAIEHQSHPAVDQRDQPGIPPTMTVLEEEELPTPSPAPSPSPELASVPERGPYVLYMPVIVD